MQALSADEERLLQHYREKLQAQSYEPLTDAQLETVKRRRMNARASAAIEGLYGAPMDDALFDLFEELRVPAEVSQVVLEDFASQTLARRSGPEAAE